MHATDLDGTVRSVVAAQLDVSPEALTPGLPLADLGVDEDGAVELLYAVEDALDVRFPDDFFDGIDTFGELASAVRVALGG